MPLSLSVVVVNYNGCGVLTAALTAVLASRPRPAQIVMVDNASNDGSVALVEATFPQVQIVRLAANRGPGPARDAGYAATATDLVAFTDNDVVVTPDCFALLAEALEHAPGAALAMPRVVHADAPGVVQYDGADAHCLGMMTLIGAERPVTERPQQPREIGSVVGACFIIDRRLWGARPLGDPRFFIYHEDHDLGLRVRQLGHRIIAVPRAVCRHGSGTPDVSLRATGTFTAVRVVHTIANRWRIVLTRYEARTILLLAPALLAFELVQLAGAASKGWLRHWAAAVGSIRRDLPAVRRERRAWRRERRLGDGLVLSGGPLPFNPRLLASPLERGAAALLAGVLGLNWMLARPFLNHRAGGREP